VATYLSCRIGSYSYSVENLHIMGGGTISDPSSYYDKLADYYYGNRALYYMGLRSEYLEQRNNMLRYNSVIPYSYLSL
jgi:hypothetical protein